MSHQPEDGIRLRCKLVEVCRTPLTAPKVAKLIGFSTSHVLHQCERLVAEGWMSMERNMDVPYYPKTFTTIREGRYSDEYDPYDLQPQPKEETIPGARVFRMEYFDSIPGYFKSSLRPLESRGIGSTFGMMETA